MKTHKTFEVTADVLRSPPIYACSIGIEDIASLLPCEVSTDPEENYDVASELVAIGEGARVEWLCYQLSYAELPDEDFEVDDDYFYRTRKNGLRGKCTRRAATLYSDVFVIAQQLAMYADQMLTLKGK